MNKQDQNRWKCDVLTLVLEALASSERLKPILVYKGARILNLRLGTLSRQSLDIDSNLNVGYELYCPEGKIGEFLEVEFFTALKKFFSKQKPVRYKVKNIRVKKNPPKGQHPFGWSGFKAKINIFDSKVVIRNFPRVEIDIASPEKLGLNAVSDLKLSDGCVVSAYTLERIAGEKLRAFLSSLPGYLTKIGRRTDIVRVKDLYDLSRISKQYAVKDSGFWQGAASEFQLACESRFIDCLGMETFSDGSAF
ncbi:MAG: nucleotidyl transferase AbiEii/AbiGii toxin family protein [Kiritimatiellae bacterium]|nr:nucleotidyl transferase AbiEii/AbiGii toxin family protein [Kiritimatiellia bacterium]